MPHVTFIHGMANKPPKEALHQIWLRTLEFNQGLDLPTQGVSSSMVYWADVLYSAPLEETGYESTQDFECTGPLPEEPGAELDLAWRDKLDGRQKNLVDAMAEKIGFNLLEKEAPPPELPEDKHEYERVFLPWFLKRELMKAFLRDVHHYLFNAQCSPRPGETYLVQTEIRRRVLQALAEGETRRPHVIVSHSMGTVIAYDCLKRVADCPAVDGLMTIGSPLAIDEIQDCLKPEWSRENGYPEKLSGGWINVYDRLDPVTGFDYEMADDYKMGGQELIEDINEQNEGQWRHSITKYLKGRMLRDGLTRLLRL